jgi:pimeloyl-ACP methyl ester carboxylesterase
MRLLKLSAMAILVVLLLVSVAPYAIPLPERASPPLVSPFANGALVEHCGTRWHLQRWEPKGSPRAMVLLLHGFAGSTYSFRFAGPALAEAGYLALAVDLPPYGFGARQAPTEPISRCVVGLAEAEAGSLPIVPVGHSMGAAVAARAAAALGMRAPGLVLVDGGLGGATRRGGALPLLAAIPPLGRWAEVVAHRSLLRPERFAATLASAYGREPTPDEVEGYRRPLLLAGTAPAVLEPWPPEHPVSPPLLPGEVLIVWGRDDTWVAPAVAERLAERLPKARLHWIEEAGHNPMETHPEAFMAALLPFLDAALEHAARAE